jgi:pimeloyl-ACP methyl ester carboxylesterase
MPLPDRQLVELDTARISYRQAGSGPDLVLLHGLAGNARTWEDQIDAFSPRYRVTAWDAPGYGESDTVEPTVDSYARTLAAFLDALGLSSVILLGHSMGGVVAGRFAALYPRRLRALVLSCTLLGRAQPAGAPLGESYRARLADHEQLTPDAYGRRRAESMAAPGCAAEILDRLSAIAAETRRDGLEAAMRVIAEADNAASLGSLDLPVLVLSGQQDRTVSAEVTAGLLAALDAGKSRVEHVALAGVGHAPYLENAPAYTAALGDYLRRL